MFDRIYDTPVFNGTACNVDCQDQSIEFRYHGVCGIEPLTAYNAFRCLDHLQPGSTLEYEDWQLVVYAARLLAKHYDWFSNLDPRNEKFKENYKKTLWNPETEEYEDFELHSKW